MNLYNVTIYNGFPKKPSRWERILKMLTAVSVFFGLADHIVEMLVHIIEHFA